MNDPEKRTTKTKITEAQARLLSFLRSPEDSYAILQMPSEPAANVSFSPTMRYAGWANSRGFVTTKPSIPAHFRESAT